MIYNVGINDVSGDSKLDSDGYYIYVKWKSMIKRCYSVEYQKIHHSYIGTTVCNEWLTYSNFKDWYLNNYIDGYVLDKDLISGDLHVYSPVTCSFVPQELNCSILESNSAKTKLPLGVSYQQKTKNMINERSKPYDSYIKMYGKLYRLGSYECPELAHKEWQIAKKKYLEELIDRYKNSVKMEVIEGIQKRIDILHNDIVNNGVTITINKI